MFSKAATPFYVPIVYEGFSFSVSLPILNIPPFDDSQPSRCEMVTHMVLI